MTLLYKDLKLLYGNKHIQDEKHLV